jgi:hypothetical protein
VRLDSPDSRAATPGSVCQRIGTAASLMREPLGRGIRVRRRVRRLPCGAETLELGARRPADVDATAIRRQISAVGPREEPTQLIAGVMSAR